MNRLSMVFSLLCIALISSVQAQEFSVSSPDKKLQVKINNGKIIRIESSFTGKAILAPSTVAMVLSDRVLGENAKVIKKQFSAVNRELKPEVKVKEALVKENYNQLSLQFTDFSFEVRVFNEGFAYRFVSQMAGDITVMEEKGNYHFPANYMCWWPKEKSFHSNNQIYYDFASLMELDSTSLGSLPLILMPAEGPKLVITESGLSDYPGMWLKGAEGMRLELTNPKYPKATRQEGDRDVFVTERENYIAKTKGERAFPWRIFAVAADDRELIKNQLTYLLADECKLTDISWIKPGRVAWDWWNANNITGVDFQSGINTQTYKYYIDFASKYGIEYIIMDEGWYKLGDLMAVVPEINMEELIRYGNEKGVGIILWVVWKTLDNQLEQAMAQFEKWGVKGIKVDFMDKDDQWMVNYYHRIAQKAADHKLLVNFHGAYKPAGLRRMYPNVLTREGVNGGEQYKWSYRQTPEHNLITPFARMLAGPMDYTPGAMRNAQEKDYKAIFDCPMSMGTRCHQLAMFVCYESPLQMLCDAPSMYYKEPEAMEFLRYVPVVWDETRVLEGKVSDYLITARRSGNEWYIGGMTDWTERTFTITLDFLQKGKNYSMYVVKDGANANMNAVDFKAETVNIKLGDRVTVKMAKGGGWVARIIEIK